ncbi:MAG: HNH endonuclease [Verrucomicrobiota bacterium]
MPDREVLTVLDLVYYQFAKILARSRLGVPGVDVARKTHFGFAKDTFRDLKAGRKLWSEVAEGNGADLDKACAYCSSRENLALDYLAPPSLRINERCATCPTLQGSANQAWACANCRARKSTRGLYEFYHFLQPDDDRFYRRIPPAVEKKYLKTIHDCLRCADVLGQKDMDGDGELTVLDLDYALRTSGKLPPPTSTESIQRIVVQEPPRKPDEA